MTVVVPDWINTKLPYYKVEFDILTLFKVILDAAAIFSIALVDVTSPVPFN
jgi:hypothetical protein